MHMQPVTALLSAGVFSVSQKGRRKLDGESEEGEYHGPLHSAIRPEKVNCFISTSL